MNKGGGLRKAIGVDSNLKHIRADIKLLHTMTEERCFNVALDLFLKDLDLRGESAFKEHFMKVYCTPDCRR